MSMNTPEPLADWERELLSNPVLPLLTPQLDEARAAAHARLGEWYAESWEHRRVDHIYQAARDACGARADELADDLWMLVMAPGRVVHDLREGWNWTESGSLIGSQRALSAVVTARGLARTGCEA